MHASTPHVNLGTKHTIHWQTGLNAVVHQSVINNPPVEMSDWHTSRHRSVKTYQRCDDPEISHPYNCVPFHVAVAVMGLNGTSYAVTGGVYSLTGGVVSVLETRQPAGTSSSPAASSLKDPCSFHAKGQ